MSDTKVYITTTEYVYDEDGRVIKETVTTTETEPVQENKAVNPPYVPWRSGGGMVKRLGDQPLVLWNGIPNAIPCSHPLPITTLDRAEQGTNRDDGVFIGREGIIEGGYL